LKHQHSQLNIKENMDYRLTLTERNQIALELRETILAKTNLPRLESIQDPSLQPHNYAVGSYAFEFCLEHFRERFQQALANITAYNNGWCTAAITRDEETPKLRDRTVRMSTELLLTDMEERGDFEMIADTLKSKELAESGIEIGRIKLFIYEITYELTAELARELLDQFSPIPPKK
jgi:hypothetical protein